MNLNLSNALKSLLRALGLGSWKAAAAAGHESLENHTTLLDARRIENFYTGSPSVLIRAKMQERSYHGKPLDLGAVLNELDVAKYANIPGLSADFLATQVAKLSVPEMTVRWKDFSACITHDNIPELGTESQKICSKLVNELPWARGRSISPIVLEPQVAKVLYAGGSRQGYREGSVTLSSLGPGETKRSDEIWALQGSEWPFVLRRRYREDDDETITGNKFSNIRSRWWWPCNSGVADRPRPAVYELLAYAYVHGLVDGEIGAEITQNLEEIIIS